MQPGGIIDLDVFLCPYVLPPGADGDGSWSFITNCHEPMLTSYGELGDPNAKVLAPGLFDYGIIDNFFVSIGDDLTDYDGSVICHANIYGGHFGLNGHIQFDRYAFANAGGVEDIIQNPQPSISPLFESDLPYPPGFEPGSPDGYILKPLAMGPMALADSHLQPVNFALPYTQYGSFNCFISTPSFGSSFSVNNASTMLGVQSYASFPAYEGPSRTNMQGMLLGATAGAYPSRALFYGWSEPFQPWATSIYQEGVNDAGGRNIDNEGFNTFLPDPDINADPVFNAAWKSGDLRTSRNWFMILGGQNFEGQPQTPYLVDANNQLYYAIRLHGHSAEADAMIVAPNGMDFAFSEKLGSLFIVNMSQSYQYIFNTVPLSLNFATPYGTVPTIKLPCYNPCVPTIIAEPGL